MGLIVSYCTEERNLLYHHIPILSCLQPLHYSHFSPVLHMYTPGALDEIWTGCPVITFQAFADLTGMNTIQRPHHEVITFLKLHLIFKTL